MSSSASLGRGIFGNTVKSSPYLPEVRRRARIFFVLVLLVVIIVLGRVVDLQVGLHEQYRVAAEDNSDYILPEPATRGVFLDRYGQPLVKNTSHYWQKRDTTTLFSQETIVSVDDALEIMATDEASIRKAYSRWYPLAEAGAHVLGYVGPISRDEMLERPGSKITDAVGRMGLERQYDHELTGSPGELEYEVNALGQTSRLIRETEMQPGETIQTTLDPFLLAESQKALAGVIGAVVIEDVQTGAILALASSPSFDPNTFTTFVQSDEEREQQQRAIVQLLKDPRQVLFDRAVAGTYPPGSIFKLVTAIAGLESGSITTSTSVLDEGVLKVGDYGYANWYYSQYGRTEGEISLQRAIARSNDIYFYKAAEFTGPDTLATWARNLGMGSKTGIELAGEAAGLVPDPAWKERTLHEQWYLGNTYHFGIGQGDVLVTPLQVAQLFQTIGNDGVRCAPHIISQAQTDCTSLGITEEHLLPVVQGMIDVCSTGGTAYPFFPYNEQHERTGNPFMEIAGGTAACKTGTAEFGPANQQGIRKTHGWFSVIVGIPDIASQIVSSEEDPAKFAWLAAQQSQALPKSVVITVLVESDETKPYREGSSDAAPIALTILERMIGSVGSP